ncbi:antitoxin Xre/MbcA/ParS toxin-binding domain-containing protein [Azospirillum sp. SYSU D00513]|uniref:type II RES/Xre toxin-antitoxin system antitoxin n=1 Tax=Azospirillum sp. SYSU D00513 TaxID=2812561 RepID=UPI001A95A332|nr:antitoxin Xre/MbcA/ParS toxin-binding domain-containing protein [Azospirillum sp. SYSU D00513]
MNTAPLADRQRSIAAGMLGLDRAPSSDFEAMRLVRNRLQPPAIAALQAAGVDQAVLSRIIPRRTLEHRRQKGEALSLEESERAYRTASILALAEVVFDSRDKALAWLTTPKRRFEGERPMDVLETELGARLVEEALIQIDEGYFG